MRDHVEIFSFDTIKAARVKKPLNRAASGSYSQGNRPKASIKQLLNNNLNSKSSQLVIIDRDEAHAGIARFIARLLNKELTWQCTESSSNYPFTAIAHYHAQNSVGSILISYIPALPDAGHQIAAKPPSFNAQLHFIKQISGAHSNLHFFCNNALDFNNAKQVPKINGCLIAYDLNEHAFHVLDTFKASKEVTAAAPIAEIRPQAPTLSALKTKIDTLFMDTKNNINTLNELKPVVLDCMKWLSGESLALAQMDPTKIKLDVIADEDEDALPVRILSAKIPDLSEHRERLLLQSINQKISGAARISLSLPPANINLDVAVLLEKVLPLLSLRYAAQNKAGTIAKTGFFSAVTATATIEPATPGSVPNQL
ncbi:MAG: hypothetical protein ACHP65_02290 [Legionellales bacterium]